MVERNAGLPPERRIEFRVGIHLGDVVEESDGDLMGDGVNIAARLEGLSESGGLCLSGAAYEQVRDRLKESFADLGATQLKNIGEPIHVYSLEVGQPAMAKSGRSSLSADQIGVLRGFVSAYSQNEVAGATQRFRALSHPRQCGLDTLRIW
jgi:adenylate cyclase